MTRGREQYWKYGLIITIVIFGALIFSKLLPFLSGVLGACTIYILVRKQMANLTEKRKMKGMLAALLIIGEVLLCFLIPAFLLIWLIIGQIERFNLNPTELISSLRHLISLVEGKTGYHIFSEDNVGSMVAFITKSGQLVIGEISSFVVNAVVMIFILYFMLIGRKAMEKYLFDIMPFNDDNKREVLGQVNRMVISNAIGIPLLAIAQGSVATMGYYIFGAPNPILFGFLTCFATIIPLVGTSLVWLPLCLYMVATGDWMHGLGLAIFALVIITNIDNLFRFMLQQKMANIHPLITVFGVIIGLSLFGFWGIIFGPLLLSIFLICFDIYKKNYLDAPDK